MIKIIISGNGKLYYHVPYTNYSSDTVKFNKGEKVGVLSIVEEVMPKTTKSVAATQEMEMSGPETVNNTNSQVKLDEETQNNLNNKNTGKNEDSKKKDDNGIDYSLPENRWEYIKTLIKGKCPTGSKAEELLNKLFKKYSNIVKCPGEILGYTDAISHEILYEGPKSIFIPPYKSTVLEEEINDEILDMLKEDLIECSKSGFNLPILIVKKNREE